MNMRIRFALWLGRTAGVDLRPHDPKLDYAASQIEALTLALERMSQARKEEMDARAVAESAYRAVLDGNVVPAAQEVWDIVPNARIVRSTIDAKAASGTSGEWKRHEAMAALKKLHPQAAERDIALAIELAGR